MKDRIGDRTKISEETWSSTCSSSNSIWIGCIISATNVKSIVKTAANTWIIGNTTSIMRKECGIIMIVASCGMMEAVPLEDLPLHQVAGALLLDTITVTDVVMDVVMDIVMDATAGVHINRHEKDASQQSGVLFI
jgi:hypothetical protein